MPMRLRCSLLLLPLLACAGPRAHEAVGSTAAVNPSSAAAPKAPVAALLGPDAPAELDAGTPEAAPAPMEDHSHHHHHH